MPKLTPLVQSLIAEPSLDRVTALLEPIVRVLILCEAHCWAESPESVAVVQILMELKEAGIEFADLCPTLDGDSCSSH